MDRDECDRKVILRYLEPVLDRDVVGVSGVLGCEHPPPGPELHPGEAPERAGAPRLVAVAPLFVLPLEAGAKMLTTASVASCTSRSPPSAAAKSSARAGS